MFGNMGKLLKLAGEIRTKLPELKARLAATEYTAQAGGGVVRATVTGDMTLVDLKIDQGFLSEGDPASRAEMLEDTIKAAVSAAQQKAAKAAAEAMKELTGGAQLPGLEGLLG